MGWKGKNEKRLGKGLAPSLSSPLAFIIFCIAILCAGLHCLNAWNSLPDYNLCLCMYVFFCLAFPHQVWQDHAHLHAWQNPFIPSVPHILNIRLFHKTHERSTPILASSWFTNRAKFIWVFLANNSYLQHKHGVGKLKRDSLGLINKEWRMINIIGYGKKIRQRLSSALPRFCWKRGSVYQVSGWNF